MNYCAKYLTITGELIWAK